MVKSAGEMLDTVVSRRASGAGMAEAMVAIEARVTRTLEKYMFAVCFVGKRECTDSSESESECQDMPLRL
jgi:hypothetical protein